MRATGPGLGVAICCVALSMLCETAQAQRGPRWPSAVVTYRDETGAPASVRAAVRLWNSATTRVRLVTARRGKRPQLRILARACPIGGFCAYYPPDGRVYIGTGVRRRAGDRPDDQLWLAVIVHEIGHALGLRHTAECGVMYPVNPLGNPGCRPRDRRRAPQPSWSHCGPQPTDARALVRLYGGRMRNSRQLGWCPPYAYPKPPAALADLVAPAGEIVIPESARPLGTSVDVVLRNRSTWAWGSLVGFPAVTGDARLRVIDAEGKPSPATACLPATVSDVASPLGLPVRVKRGGTATYPLRVCGDGVSDSGVVQLQLLSFSRGGERPGPVFTIRWRMDRAPVAAFTVAPAGGSISAGTGILTFTDTSTDDRGPITTRRWSFGDGAASETTGTTVQHSFDDPGSYRVELVVSDGAGQTSTTTRTIEITE